MAKIKLVKCQLVKNGGAPSDEDLRYVPLQEFKLWEYYMQHRYGWKVLVVQTSYWMDEEEVHWESAGVALERLERVDRVTVEWIDDENVIIPQERYFPEEMYESRKQHFLKHYPTHKTVNDLPMVSRRVEETKGYFVRTRTTGSEVEAGPDRGDGPQKDSYRASA